MSANSVCIIKGASYLQTHLLHSTFLNYSIHIAVDMYSLSICTVRSSLLIRAREGVSKRNFSTVAKLEGFLQPLPYDVGGKVQT